MFDGVREGKKLYTRCAMLVAICSLVCFFGACKKSAEPVLVAVAQTTFSTPEGAGQALAAAVKAGDHPTLVAIFGPGSADLIFSGDAAEDKATFEHFTAAYETMNRWRKQSDASQVLVVGADNNPFPIPVNKNGAGKWYLGNSSVALAQAMTEFNPDQAWYPVTE
jgi:hypothetical protein